MFAKVVLLFATMLTFTSGIAFAQIEAQDLTIYAAVCPVDYKGETFFQDCFANSGESYGFDPRVSSETIDFPMPTDASGFVTFDITGWTPDTIVVPAHGPSFFDPSLDDLYYDVAVAFCVAEDVRLDTFFLDVAAAGPVVAIDVPTTADVRCDFYFVPRTLESSSNGEDRSEEAGTLGGDGDNAPSNDVTSPDVTTLPSTGSGTTWGGIQSTPVAVILLLMSLMTGMMWLRCQAEVVDGPRIKSKRRQENEAGRFLSAVPTREGSCHQSFCLDKK